VTRRVLQVLAHGIAILALAVLGLRPSRRVSVPAGDVVLATAGADAAAARRLADSAGAALVRIPDDVPDAAAFARTRGDARAAIVAGWGLTDPEELGTMALIPRPAAVPAGLAHVSGPSVVALGEPLVIEGTVRGAARGAVVTLAGPGGDADSAALGDDGRFRLRDVPRAAGRHDYAIRVEPPGGTVAETLGVEVTAPVPPRVLLLAAAPSFEHRALRDWLAARGGAVAVRAAVSRGRWYVELVNRAAMPLVPLTAPALAEVDVVVTDPRALAALGAAERRLLRRHVIDSGLGVVVTGVEGDDALLQPFATTPIADLGERLVRPALAGLPPARTAVPARGAALVDRFAVGTVIRDGAGVALVQVAPRGAGVVAVSLVEETARWVRAGEHATYAAFWSRVLERVARPRPVWQAAGSGPHLMDGPPVTLVGPSGAAAVRVTSPSGAVDSVYVAPDALAPDRSRGTYWPREPGWHAVGTDGRAFRVAPAGAWRAREAARRVAATARAAVRASATGDPAESAPEERRPVPLAWAFVLFVVATGYLWAARR
jgi:hypothetical protein